MTEHLEFTVDRNANPASDEVRAAILANPGFGRHHTDHMVSIDYIDGKGWHNARVMPYGPIELDPSAIVLHYAQEVFEGLKAYRWADGSIVSFRPEANAARLRTSARRLAIPELPDEVFIEPMALSPDTRKMLTEMGYKITEQATWGTAAAILVMPEAVERTASPAAAEPRNPTASEK